MKQDATAPMYHKCYQCGKYFFVGIVDKWAYKKRINDKDKWFCSWKCLSSWYKENEDDEAPV